MASRCSRVIGDFLDRSDLYDDNGTCTICRGFVGDHPETLQVKAKILLVWNCETDEFEEISEGAMSASPPVTLICTPAHVQPSSSTLSLTVSMKREREGLLDCAAKSIKSETNDLPRRKKSSNNEDEDEDEDEEVLSVVGPKVSSSSTVSQGAGDDDLEYAGYTGANALSDFPHARENCAVYKFKVGDAFRTCANCYCYVCDALASTCTQWEVHCNAIHGSALWRERRAVAATLKTAPVLSSAVSAVAACAPSSYIYRRPELPRCPATPFSRAEQILKAIEQVYPVEAPDPPGLAEGIVLRPYQRQSLAFMLDLEERIARKDSGAGSGGWLSDEMGMGKTAVCAALILANRKPETDAGLKATLVITNTTLTKQWISELKKFAPGLKVGFFFGADKYFKLGDPKTYDVIVTSFHTQDKNSLLFHRHFHRKIVDEAHLAGLHSSLFTESTFTWNVTGTPFSSTVKDLEISAQRVEHWKWGSNLYTLTKNPSLICETISALRKVMIRHTKSQRIAGDVALSLPDSSTEIVWLTMNENERSQYEIAEVRQIYEGTSTFGIEMALAKQRQICANIFDAACYQDSPRTKLNALIADINELRGIEPSLHAVVLTHFESSFQSICSALKHNGYNVCSFSGRSPAPIRHRAIEEFQRGTDLTQSMSPLFVPTPTVFVATMAIGNVGINLTAASRVYLYEPCLDPQMEVQAAGRIHRLGQNRPVLVKKLVFSNTIESNIVELHKAIKDGQVAIPKGVFPFDAIKILRANTNTNSTPSNY